MEFIDRKRCRELYLHDCSAHYKVKGFGKLYVADGNWKLRYAHCMWKVPIELVGFGTINYPSICPLSPKRGHAFCNTRCVNAEALGYPTKLGEFLRNVVSRIQLLMKHWLKCHQSHYQIRCWKPSMIFLTQLLKFVQMTM